MNGFVFDLQRFLNVTVTASNTLVSGSANADGIFVGRYGIAVSGVTVDSGAGNDYIENNWDSTNAVIKAGDGNNRVDNHGSNVTIVSGSGNDYVYAGYQSSVTITSGAGNDTIQLGAGVRPTITDFDVSDKLRLERVGKHRK